ALIRRMSRRRSLRFANRSDKTTKKTRILTTKNTKSTKIFYDLKIFVLFVVKNQKLESAGVHIDLDGFDAPDLICVLLDRAIGGEFPHIRDVHDRFLGPLIGLAIGLAYA